MKKILMLTVLLISVFMVNDSMAGENSVLSKADMERLAGEWYGLLKMPENAPIIQVFRFKVKENGEFNTSYDMPDDGIIGVTVSDMDLVDGTNTLKFSYDLGEYKGKIIGDEIVGEVINSGKLTLKKGEYKPDRNLNLSKDIRNKLLGDWHGHVKTPDGSVVDVAFFFGTTAKGDFVGSYEERGYPYNPSIKEADYTNNKLTLNIGAFFNVKFKGTLAGDVLTGEMMHPGLGNIHLSMKKAENFKNVKEISFKQVNTSESDEIRTLKSLQKIGNIYMITYYGDYNDRLDEINRRILKESFEKTSNLNGGKINCSIFAALGNPDNLIYGRNFDNPDCGVLIGYYNPSDGYASIGFSRINNLEFGKDQDLMGVPVEKRELLLNSVFGTSDGINECGVAVALATTRGMNTKVDKNRKSIFITYLVREILDHAKNIEDAVKICKSYNVFDNGESMVSHHLLISDPSRESVVVEYNNGEWKVMPNKKPWQVITNSHLYNVSEEERKINCWRYKRAYELLDGLNGDVDWQKGMNILKNLSMQGTQWSTICDMKRKEIYISLYRDYENIMKVSLKTD